MNARRLVGLLLIAGCLPGCGSSNPDTYEARGIVVFADGSPVSGGSIEFETEVENKLVTARAEIGEDGRFTLGTYKSEDGAVPGKHRVAVFAEPEIGTGYERPDKLPPAKVDPKFASFATSGLSFTVKEDENEFRVVVAAPKKKP